MVLFFTITLGFSILGLIILFGLKRFELTSGRVMFASARPNMNMFFSRGLSLFEYVLPSLMKRGVGGIWGSVRNAVKAILARLMFAFEYTLERLLGMLRRQTEAPLESRNHVSAFLREVVEHKRDLLKRAKSERVILDE